MVDKKKKESEVLDDSFLNETVINPHEILDEADILDEIDDFTRNNVELD